MFILINSIQSRSKKCRKLCYVYWPYFKYFKTRYGNHKISFANSNRKDETSLSNFIWDLKSKGKDFSINWSIAKHAAPYSPVSKYCNLCLTEKTLILLSKDEHLLNKRSEIISSCSHRRKYTLGSVT